MSDIENLLFERPFGGIDTVIQKQLLTSIAFSHSLSGCSEDYLQDNQFGGVK